MTGNYLVEGETELWRNDQWRVTNMHIEELSDGTTCGPPYWIAIEDLHTQDWIGHMAEKTWVDIDQFREAYEWACDQAGGKRWIVRGAA